MTQISYTVDNGSGLAVRTNINQVLAAIKSTNSGNTAPSETVPYMLWADTANNRLKIRNTNDTAFVDLFGLDGSITMPDGTNSSPGMAFSDDSDTGIFSGADNQFNIATAGSERMKMDATAVVFNDVGANTDFRIEGDTDTTLFTVDAGTNKIGIGIGSPTEKLTVEGTIQCLNKITSKSGNDLILNAGSAGQDLSFRVNDQTKMFINGTSSAVGINTSSPDNLLHVFKATAGSVSAHTSAVITLENNADASLQFLSPSSSTAQIRFGDEADNGIGFIKYIHSSNSLDLGTNGSEKLRIDTNGRIFCGRSHSDTSFAGGELEIKGSIGFNDTGIAIRTSTSDHSNRFFIVFRNSSNATQGSIAMSGRTNVSFNQSSDYRLKENEIIISDGITRIKKLKARRFNFKDEPTVTRDGFFAHEVSSVVPEAITGEKDEMKAETFYEDGDSIPSGKKIGDPKTYSSSEIQPQQIDQSKLVPLLVAGLQELITRVENLESA